VSEKTVSAVQFALRQMATDESGTDYSYTTPYDDAQKGFEAAKRALEIVRAEAIRDLGVD
jgi:hypothetical protein